MKFRFRGDPNNEFSGPDEICLYGLTFRRDSWTEVPPQLTERLSRHNHFESRGGLIAPSPEVPTAALAPGFLGWLRGLVT